MAKLLGLILALAFSELAGARDLDKLYEKTSLRIAKQKFTAYIADDDGKREQGLMYVDKMPENRGMLFIFPQERPLGFWMKNTLIPLQIGFFDHQGKLVDVQEMKVAASVLSPQIPTYESHAEAQFALEMNTGWFTRHKIKAGDKLELDSTPKSEILNRLLPRKRVKFTRQ